MRRVTALFPCTFLTSAVSAPLSPTFLHLFTGVPAPLHQRVLGSSSLLVYLFTGTNLCGTPICGEEYCVD